MKKKLVCLFILSQFGAFSPSVWAVVPPSTSLEEGQELSDQPDDQKLGKAIEELKSQEDRLRIIVDQLEQDHQKIQKSQENRSPQKPLQEEKSNGYSLH